MTYTVVFRQEGEWRPLPDFKAMSFAGPPDFYADLTLTAIAVLVANGAPQRSGRYAVIEDPDPLDAPLDLAGGRVVVLERILVAIRDVRGTWSTVTVEDDPSGFYVRDMSARLSDDALWWAPHRRGYTSRLERAGVYDKDDALSIARIRGTDLPYPKSKVDAIAHRGVARDVLDAMGRGRVQS